MARIAALHGIDTPPLTAYRMLSAGRSAILLGYTPFTEHEITEGMQRLASVWSQARRPAES